MDIFDSAYDYLLNNPVWLWVGAALVFAIIEITLPLLISLFMGVAALAAGMAAFFGLGVKTQLFVFGLAMLVQLWYLRPHLVARLHARQTVPSRTEALVGKLGRVTEAIDPVSGSGRVMVEGLDWAASCQTGLAVGTEVEVLAADGIVLKVRAAKTAPLS